jgi:D-amino-acid dehydrogenase
MNLAETTEMYDAIVVGGGIVGLSTAYHLVSAGVRTLLVDRADAGQATAAGAGILSPETSNHESEAWFDFAVTAVDYYPVLIERLVADDAGDTGYGRTGQLIVAVGEDEDAAFDQAWDRIFSRQARRGSPEQVDLFEVDGAEAQRMFPPLARVRRALYYRHAARVDGRLLAAALLRAAESRGLTVLRTGAERLLIDSGTVAGVVASGEEVRARGVLIAGGAWSPELAGQLGLMLPIAPQRGQIVHLGLPGVATGNWPIITAFHGHYMVPWPDGRVVVGATRETGSGFAPHTTAAGLNEVLSEALRVAPGLAEASIADIRVGLRPATPDSLPVLGAVPGVRNVYIAAGHGATGLQLGPYSGKLMADLLLGSPLQNDISAFSPTRF